MKKRINFFWFTDFFLPAINATVFSMRHVFVRSLEEIEDSTKTFWNYLTFNKDMLRKLSGIAWKKKLIPFLSLTIFVRSKCNNMYFLIFPINLKFEIFIGILPVTHILVNQFVIFI